MKLKDTPDVIRPCLPADCIGCECAGHCGSTVRESRQVVDICITSEQSRYDLIERVCPKSGKTLAGVFPEGVNAPQQYGNNLKAMVVTLSSFGMVSTSRISEMMGGLTGLSISDGTICNILADCARRCTELLPELKNKVRSSAVAHFDETGIRVGGKVHWAHTASTELITLISAHQKRGVAGILAGGVLKGYEGIAVHDCWGPYYHKEFAGILHAVCGAHIDRELEGIIQHTTQRWPRSFRRLLKKLYGRKRKLLAQGIDHASPEEIAEIFEEYDRILKKGFSRNPYPKSEQVKRGRPKRGKILSLLERLRDLKDSVLRFFTDFRVPFSNNIGEKSFRLSKLKMKVAGSFRSDSGGSNFCTIFSVIDTVRKHGGNPFEALSALFTNSFSLDFLS
ncbi:MAG: IS66 family transposase [Spirochaetia bacterium]|nr:IS66 family transposase [Spirochaetia bacterium]